MDFVGRLVQSFFGGAIGGLGYVIWAFHTHHYPFADEEFSAPQDPVRLPLPEHGPWDELAYWDPVPTARATTGDTGAGGADRPPSPRGVTGAAAAGVGGQSAVVAAAVGAAAGRMPADHFSSTLPNFQKASAPAQVRTKRPTIA